MEPDEEVVEGVGCAEFVVVFASQQDLDAVGYAAEFADVELAVFAFAAYDLGAAEGPVADVKALVLRLLVREFQVSGTPDFVLTMS